MPARVVAKLLRLSLVVLCATAALAHGRAWSAEAGADDAGVELYEKKIRPALVEHCLKCHGPDKQEASLQLDSVAAMLRGGDQGPSIVPGDPDASLLVQAIRYDDVNFQMPPKGKMPDDVVAAFEKWVSVGAPAPASEQRKPETAAVKKFDLAERAKHWCFQPIRAVPPPQTHDQAWPRGAVDRFLLQKLEEAGLRPAREAEPYEVVRRLSYDLIGLPPTPDETAAFVRDYGHAIDDAAREAVYGATVDRLLASPHFGERWARHWLDLVRYAETRGHEFDHAIPNAFQYRDYVIRALNADVPYDRFVVEHLAGDLLPEPRRRPQTGGNESNESILGTGFWFLGEEVHSPVDIRQDETDRVDNKIDVMSKTFLGLTLACARCHDHKFDALSTKDYYATAGFVLGMSQRQAAFETAEHNKRIAQQIAVLDREHEAAVRAAQLELWRPVLDKLDRYLLAAREVEAAVRAADGDVETALTAAVAAAAQEFDLDAVRLAAWYEYLASANAPHETLRPWVDYLRTAKLPVTRALGGASTDATSARPPRVVIDFTRPQPGQWLEDGLVFGGAPREVGALSIGRDAARPITAVAPQRAAVADLRWSALAEAVVGDSGPGRVNWAQAGRTLKTPTFTLTTGKLRYLVRGSGHVYACVASHRLNNGPLHGQLIKRFDGDGRTPTFVEHDLSAYVGQRLHLEFSPLESDQAKEKHSSEMALLGVVELNEPASPTLRYELFIPEADYVADSQQWLDRLNLPALAKLEPEQQAGKFAKGIQTAMAEMAEAVADPARAHRPLPAAMIDWMLKRPELIATPSAGVESRLADYFAKREALWKQAKPIGPTAPAAWEGSAVDEYVLIRGNHRTVGELVPRRFLEAIDGETPPAYGNSGGRLALAERLVDRSDPLPARVMVNRLWQHLFGQGLVRTVDNFGAMGELPTHPELLDYLAQQFMDDGWSVKRMIRTLVTSRAYRMSSRVEMVSVGDGAVVGESAPSPPAPLPQGGEGRQIADASVVDPLNKLLHRANAKRLEGEIVRDAMLAVSGRLDRTLFGPSVETYITPFMDGRGKPQSGPLDGNGRRSIYLKVRRNFLNPMFQAFDYPTPFTSVGRRSMSNVPQQSLSLMNGELPTLLAEHWAKRLLADKSALPEQRIGLLYREA
ncbi:MAG: PSD1 domain-containing protein, partial [Planctomycetales bacterium]|nr:PSD1 domain-containing protein [Planctomycetales bacterium]